MKNLLKTTNKYLILILKISPCAFLLWIAGCTNTEVDNQSRPKNLTCLAPKTPPQKNQVVIQNAFPNLSFILPVGLIQAPNDDSHWYVLEQAGIIYKFENNENTASKDVFIDITDRVLGPDHFLETGLMGAAFHPDFENNGKVFLFYTTQDGGTDYAGCNPIYCSARGILSVFTMKPDKTGLDPTSEQVLLDIFLPDSRHHAGHIVFGPDGYLYLSLGDGGRYFVSQEPDSLLGSLLRLDVDSAFPYAIPPGNPFNGPGERPEIYAIGFRNPWKWSFDRLTGEIWAGDVGHANWEEIDFVEKGKNYGWPINEGHSCFHGPCDAEGLTPPVSAYSHDDGCSITGGYVYRGEKIKNLKGTYLYGDLCSGNLWGITRGPENSFDTKLMGFTEKSISAFAEDTSGEIFFSAIFEGEIYKISDLITNEISEFPERLSQTGCFEAQDSKIPTQGLIPYEVNSPLWSDGAVKERWMALPDGEKIDINEEGKFIFPVGSVLVKNFILEGKLVETRLFMHHQEDQWAGYSYEWNDEQTEASLVELSGKQKTLKNGQQWWFPSRGQCLRCHTSVAGRVLGPEIPQLNRLFNYPGTGIVANQLDTMKAMGLFEEALSIVPDDLPKFPDFSILSQTNGQETELARAYLHANCSFCHRPEGPGIGPADFRYHVSEEDMKLCNVSATVETDLDTENPVLINPGEPEKSILHYRINTINKDRMPPLSTNVIDNTGVEVIGEWISAMENCPE